MLSDVIRKVYKLVKSKLPIPTNFSNNFIESLLQITVPPMINQINIKSNMTEVAPTNSLIAGTLFFTIVHISINLLLRRAFGIELLL
jgi:hypothetical protein